MREAAGIVGSLCPKNAEGSDNSNKDEWEQLRVLGVFLQVTSTSEQDRLSFLIAVPVVCHAFGIWDGLSVRLTTTLDLLWYGQKP